MITVMTHDGIPVAIGRVALSMEASTPRVELTFKTHLVRCTVRLLPDEIEALLRSEEAETFRHRLPADNKLWLGDYPAADEAKDTKGPKSSIADDPKVEAYPLPPESKLGASLPVPTVNQPPAATSAKGTPTKPVGTPQLTKPAGLSRLKVAPVVPLPGRRPA